MPFTTTSFAGESTRLADINEVIKAVNQLCAITGEAVLDEVAANASIDAATAAAICNKLDSLVPYFLVSHTSRVKRDADYYDDESVHALEYWTKGNVIADAKGEAWSNWPRWTTDPTGAPEAWGATAAGDILHHDLIELWQAVLERLVWTWAEGAWQATSLDVHADYGSNSMSGDWENGTDGAKDIAIAGTGGPAPYVQGRYTAGVLADMGGGVHSCEAKIIATRDKATVALGTTISRTIRWRMKGDVATVPGFVVADDTRTFDGDTDLSVENVYQVTHFGDGTTASVDAANTAASPVSSDYLGEDARPATWCGAPTLDAGNMIRGYAVTGNPDVICQWESGLDYID